MLKQSIGSAIANSFGSLPLFDSPIIAADGIFKYIEGVMSIKWGWCDRIILNELSYKYQNS